MKGENLKTEYGFSFLHIAYNTWKNCIKWISAYTGMGMFIKLSLMRIQLNQHVSLSKTVKMRLE